MFESNFDAQGENYKFGIIVASWSLKLDANKAGDGKPADHAVLHNVGNSSFNPATQVLIKILFFLNWKF